MPEGLPERPVGLLLGLRACHRGLRAYQEGLGPGGVIWMNGRTEFLTILQDIVPTGPLSKKNAPYEEIIIRRTHTGCNVNQ